MIQVERLSKRYGAALAVDRLTFGVGRGEVVGFLGPNGAGKTTTMRILTTFLAPTSGRARLAGCDVLDEPLAVRKHIGYLPENVPLYPEMRVREYLDFRARLKDVPRVDRKRAIARVVERCHLGPVENRILGHLSKGYRQRVGLAEAMVHDPDILILDEPTAGLDPIQIREVRALIRELGDRHTILLSTHIMQEVEAVCSRVLLIARGRIAIDEALDRLRAGVAVEVEVRGPAEAVRKALETAPGVARVVAAGAGVGTTGDGDGDTHVFVAHARGDEDLRETLAARVVQNGWGLRRLDLRRSTLEDRFVQAVVNADAEAAGEGEAA